MTSFTTSSSSSSLVPKTLHPVSQITRFPTISSIRLVGKWNHPLIRSISTADSRRWVAIVKAATVDLDYS
ncbi:unnamed protein product [Eruca vesicaria subsp. sativa]|uniref:Uncharacterized protein n=1 Tax=Eruca vesicaria subsp. sativa TaxID=29727 RepID=A0ABC8JXY4_ERUVS|nr:unnamed protein product [Eruca vesicaria subsp. sativa]